MSSKDNILRRMRRAPSPFEDIPVPDERMVVEPMDGEPLVEHFIQQLQVLSANVLHTDDRATAIETILNIIGDDTNILAWDLEHIPLPALAETLAEKDIKIADSRDGSVRVGITGVEAALGATGSLVMSALPGKPRSVSLLPHVHIAVLTEAQILPHFEAWIAQVKTSTDSFRQAGNHIIITGASRTGDIGFELVLGAHGPAVLHVIILK